MAQVDISRLIWVVTGVQLNAELGDRPLAYRVEQEIRRLLREMLPEPAEGEVLPRLVPAVVSDVYYLNSEEAQERPVISIGGPGVNAVSNALLNDVPTAVAIEDALLVQMDVEMQDHRCCVWGMDHLRTVQAVELFIGKGYLEVFVRGIVEAEG